MSVEFAVIHVEIDDELTDVLEKIKSIKSNLLLVYIPGRSLLLTSIINLQLFAKKAEKEGKKLIIITKDRIGRVLAEKAHLNAVRDDAELKEYLKKNFDHEFEPTIEEVVDENKKVLGTTIFHKFWYSLLHVLGADEEPVPKAKLRLSLIYAYKKAFVSILVFSFLILFAVTFFALPEATIIIQPKLANLPATSNITLALTPTDISQLNIQMYPITTTYETSIDYPATGKEFQGTLSTGTVTLYNMASEDRSIITRSRLQTDGGLVFVTKKFVTVPHARSGQPGKVDVEVEARDKDVNGDFIGDKGNIEPSKFFFPALTQDSQKFIWGESTEKFTGGTTEIDYTIVKQDIDNASRNIVIDLDNVAPEELGKELKKTDKKSEGEYEVFQVHDKRFVKTELVNVTIPSDLIGKKLEHFSVVGKMKATAWYYNKDELIGILKNHLLTHQLTFTEELIGMDQTSLKFINIFPPKDNVIKVTAAMNGLVRYNFAKDDQTLVSEIQKNVAGLDKDAAVAALSNMPEIDHVEIELSPMWQKTIPPLHERIKVVIKDVK